MSSHREMGVSCRSNITFSFVITLLSSEKESLGVRGLSLDVGLSRCISTFFMIVWPASPVLQ